MYPVILDTGPLIALFNQRDTHHAWVITQFKTITPPLLTCEAVVTEACFLLQKQAPAALPRLFQAFNHRLFEIAFEFEEEILALQDLMDKYTNVPMSLADACLVRMSELYPQAHLLTLDSDFYVYRRNRHQTIPCIMPPKG